MNDFNEPMFEFAKTCQALIQLGYSFGEINYGERRLGIGPSMPVTKNSETTTLYDYQDLEILLNKEIEKTVAASYNA